MIVLDASAALELLFARQHAGEVRERLDRDEWQVVAPHLLETEVLNAMRRWLRSGAINAAEASEGRALLRWMRIRHVDHRPLSNRVWELRDNLTAYDATYVALAEATGSELLTGDVRLAHAPGHSARVTLFGS